MRTHADSGWDRYPSYLPTLVPRVLRLLGERGLRITFFLVGKDASFGENREFLRSITAAGHEVGNHSLNHLQWLHRLPDDELEREIAESEEHIEAATGQRPRGFRGPGFACSVRLLRVLKRHGYDYDCSTFPTFVGPLARAYYFMSARKLSATEKEQRQDLFGDVRDGLRPLGGYLWDLGDAGTGPGARTSADADADASAGGPRELLEIPVTTMPLLRAPIHMSYVLYLAQRSEWLAQTYLRTAIGLCQRTGVELSFLLHPLDFISGDTCPALRFFPAMSMPAERKRALVAQALATIREHFDAVPMGEHARRLLKRPDLPRRAADLAL
jgi:hypothetical protein